MIDIHHHLLYGIDDGSKDLANSVAMVELAAADGITHIVATPHANHTYDYNRDENTLLLQNIREALPAELASKVTLGLGCDFHVNVENIADAHDHPQRYTINGTEYLLIELADFNVPTQMADILYALRLDGMTPILTHPERNATLQREPKRLEAWLESGLLLQVTAGSVTGNFGPKAEAMAWKLLRANQVHFLATDAHDVKRRPPVMSAARELVAKRLGAARADLLFVENPLAVFEGRPLPPQDVPDDRLEAENENSSTLWQRLFGKRS